MPLDSPYLSSKRKVISVGTSCALGMIALSLCACSSSSIHFDTNLIQPYRFEMEKENPFSPPYVAKLEKGEKRVLYLAALHTLGAKDPFETPTFKSIHALVNRYRPRVVVVEGYKTGDELSPPSISKHAAKCEAEKFKTCGEPAFVVLEAKRIGADFISGEPSERFILESVLAEGRVEKDLLGFYLVRQIPQWRKSGELKDFDRKAEDLLALYRELFGSSISFSLAEFRDWYRTHVNVPKQLLDVTTDDVAPNSGQGATYLQQISSQVGRIRDRSIVETIEKMVNKFSNVLVVYGASHLLTQRPALESGLGKAGVFVVEGGLDFLRK
jgi:hypothetical protein